MELEHALFQCLWLFGFSCAFWNCRDGFLTSPLCYALEPCCVDSSILFCVRPIVSLCSPPAVASLFHLGALPCCGSQTVELLSSAQRGVCASLCPEGPTGELSCHEVHQTFQTSQECHGMPIPKECSTTLHKIVPRECPMNVFHKSVHGECLSGATAAYHAPLVGQGSI